MEKVHYVNKRMLATINRLVIEMTGGIVHSKSNIRDGLSLGFVEHIYHNEIFGQKMYPDLFHQAAAYLFHVIKDHVFMDGNKRTGLAAAVAFLESNNILFSPMDEDAVYDFIDGVAGGVNDPGEMIPHIAEWLQGQCLY